jgi:FkbM family methyltransferase
MKFIFIESFNINGWNGNTARNIKGVSGSHTAPMYLAEALAKEGNIVEFVSLNNCLIEENFLGVQYTNFDNFKVKSCDYIIATNRFSSLNILEKITSFSKIIIITHGELWYNQDEINRFLNIDKSKILIGYISEFAKTFLLNLHPFLKDYNNVLIYNSLDLNDIQKFDIGEKDKSICFFACVDRGFKMVTEILKKLDNYTLFTNTYADEHRYLMIQNENNNKCNIVLTGNTSKYNVFNYISKSRYFVYPLINLDNNWIHYDTFAYVVLEALLHGTIVITPRIGVFEELYGDAICYIDTDDIIDKKDLIQVDRSNFLKPQPNFGYPILDRYVDKINLLDENEDLRKEYIKKGLLLGEKFSNKKIGNELLKYLNQEYSNSLRNHLTNISNKELMPRKHVDYLIHLKKSGFEPKVIYDIGSCVLHWTHEVKKLWPNAQIILFDAFEPAEFLYEGYDYYVGVLSDTDDKIVNYYQNDFLPGGNSYYREIGCENGKYFPEDKYIEKKTKTLDTIIKERGFPLPDFVKMDVQGAEVDIIKGGINTLKNATRLITELQHVDYNRDAPKSSVAVPLIEKLLGFKCIDPLFQNNGPDGDYGFVNETKYNEVDINNNMKQQTILTIFAGREKNLKILCKYLKKALELKIIDEVHFWNNTRNILDENYIKSISNLKRSSSAGSGNYVLITPVIQNNSFELEIRAVNDAHIKIKDKTNNEYEIVLGGWYNTISCIRYKQYFGYLDQTNIIDSEYKNKFTIKIHNNILYVLKNDCLLMSEKIIENFEINEIYFKTGHNSVGHLSYKTTKNEGFYLMDTCEKSWKNYYQYYSDTEYKNTTILKCDDDIVFMDLNKLENFINFIKSNTEYELVFANTINNGVSAYYQQNKYNLIPTDLIELEYPDSGSGGSLWESGEKAEKIHKYFIENYNKFLDYNYNNDIIPINTRYSINFFGYKGSNWYKIQDSYMNNEDEYNLTVDYVNNRGFKNALYADFYVSHLSFYKQVETGINSDKLIKLYEKLSDEYINNKLILGQHLLQRSDELRLVDIKVTDENTALNLLVNFLHLAQKRGTFTLDESAKIWECIQKFQHPN